MAGEEGSVLLMFAAVRNEGPQAMIPSPAEQNQGRDAGYWGRRRSYSRLRLPRPSVARPGLATFAAVVSGLR